MTGQMDDRMDGWRDGWMESFTTSFTICNFERWYFGLCWNLRLVSYDSFKDFGLFFLKTIFLHGEIFEFP
jgi:hypothetical protein